jgi:hypothetical protein
MMEVGEISINMTIPSKIVRDYIACAAILTLALTFAFTRIVPLGSVPRIVAWLAILGIGITTFRWGEVRGFPASSKSGALQLENVVRSLVMTAVMSVIVVLVSVPFISLLLHFARK